MTRSEKVADTRNVQLADTLEVVEQTQATAQLETPRILNRNLIPSLTRGLDASDALECYTLVRLAPLHGIANSTISVQKMAVGIRYRPKGGGADLTVENAKRPIEMTLEYGPLRVGALLNDESMPIVQVEEPTSYLSWDNVGKVYFTRKIVKEHFLSSYYMASITGAVLDQLLTEAVDYTDRHKAYQPFSVYSEEKGRELRSSSSSDFVWYIWSHLAKLGVEVDPILPPPVYEARLHVKSVSKVVPDAHVARQAALFYQKLFDCLEAIATNNYGSFGQTVTSSGSSKDSTAAVGDDDDDDDQDRDENDKKGRRLDSSESGDGRTHTHMHIPSSEPIVHADTEPDVVNAYETAFPIAPPSIQASPTSEQSFGNDEFLPDEDEEDENDDFVAPEQSGLLDPGPSSNIDNQDEPGEGVEKTQQAANVAQKAAEEAKEAAVTEGETKAADAAQAAADAAQAAADATSEAASKAAMDSILSGDGSMMSSIIATCLSNPRYEISVVDDNGTVTTEAYLYRDSFFYYKVDLVSPYVSVGKLNRGLPRAVILSDYGAGGDVVDWLIAITIGFSVVFMVLLICQQMGIYWVGSIFRCQRWFFNPRKSDYEGDVIDGVQSGALFFFGESGIPLSMGGKQSSYSPIEQQDTLQQVMAEVHENDNTVVYSSLSSQMARGTRMMSNSSMELEMSELHQSTLGNGGNPSCSIQVAQREKSNPSVGCDDKIVDGVPERLLRDPELVELPSLKSKSRVAVPVGSSTTPASANNSQHRSGSFADDASASSLYSRSSDGESPFVKPTFL